ncbi:MAG: class flavin-dependent oxidoreductase [Candidatus Solibacter sp.]|nr:class flavin-dependent oxidoreductase [Candidatus Solibacter sp.]
MNRNPPIGIACLVVLVGPPGSGKSTWARRNGRGAIHVSQDGLIDAISPDGFEHVYRPIYAAAEDALARAALHSGHTVIVDRTNRTREHRRRWLDVAREAGCPAVAVVMTASASLCRSRNRERDSGRRLSEERIERMLAALEPVQPAEGFLAVFEDTITLAEMLSQLSTGRKGLSHEYCHEAR